MHVSLHELLDWIDGHSPAEGRERLEQHLASCPACTARSAEWRQLITTMISDRTPEPPAHVVEAVLRLFERAPLRERVREWLRGLVEEAGRLVFDSTSGLTPAFAGARRGAVSGRRLRFEGAGFELDVQLAAPAGGNQLIAQVLTLAGEPRPASRVRYLVTAGGDVVAAGEADALGEFITTLPSQTGLRIHLSSGQQAAVFALPGPGEPEPPH